MQEVIYAEVDRMIAEGVIEPSTSPWSSPIVIVQKRDGKPRFCIDFRKVNDVSVKDAYPLPYIQGILAKLREAKYISSIDLKQGYWQIPLSPKSKPITAFTVPGRGLYQFKVMPFGLHSAPATFQRLLDSIIGPELEPAAFAYLDDIIVLGKTFEEHLANLREVFTRLQKANLKLNPEKCQFGRRTLKYLGHVVTPEGIRTDPDKVSAVHEIPAPSNIRGLRRFLGMASWYRRFVPAFSKVVAPLTKLLRKGQKWIWETEQEDAFQALKHHLTAAPVLACPDFNREFTLQTDASDQGLGVALTQTFEDGEHVIEYASRTLNPAEKNYSTTDKECLGVVFGIEKMRPYLEGYHFTVLTDHQSLKWLRSIKSPQGRIARWRVFLDQFDFTIHYRKGTSNRVADALSRDPLPVPADTDVALIEESDHCNWYKNKMAEVKQNPANTPDYSIRNEQLYRHIWDNRDPTEPELSNPWKLCVPKPLRRRVLEETHDEPTAGHLGIAKTTARVAQKYYWPGMFRDIIQYVRGCLQCQRYKSSQQQPAGKMQPTRNLYPWETVSTDLIGPLPRSTKGNNFLAVFQDRFTKWVVCRPLRKATAQAITRAFLEEIICKFGTPRTTITDNGTQYESRIFKELLKELGVTQRFTPVYTPQDNPVERANKTIKTIIAEYCEENHRHWDQHLAEFTFAVNSSKHESTGFSPALLNFGREFELPKALHRESEPDPPVPDHNEIPTEHLNRLQKLRETFEQVRVRLSHAFANQSRHYNLRRREWRCHPGDLVMKKEHPLSNAAKGYAAKLAPKFSGPYTVLKVLTPVIVNLKDATGAKHNRIHIKDLKPYYPQDEGFTQD